MVNYIKHFEYLENLIDYKEILGIADAFQIASGQNFAIGKIKGLLEFIIKGNSLKIKNFKQSNNEKIISSIEELEVVFNDIDPYIELKKDKEFKKYFNDK